MNWVWPLPRQGVVWACGDGKILIPWRFWAQPWKRAEPRCSVLGRQLYAVYSVLQQVEAITEGFHDA